jgi:SAM-dependent methyltransferase
LELLEDADVLCLASGGGQQGPTFAAAGARVTVVDFSAGQLEKDRQVADAHGLVLRTVQADMADLSSLPTDGFDVVFHPCANMFVPDLAPVWAEARRMLRTGGHLLSGFNNPCL